MSFVAALLPLLLQASSVDPDSRDRVIHYTVRPGDFPNRIAGALTRPRDIGTVIRLNRLKESDPLIAGTVLTIPRTLLRQVTIRARIQAVRGDVRIDGMSRIRVGARIGEGAHIVTGADSSISLRLPDRSIVTLPSASAIRVERLRRILLAGVLDRRFSLERGRSEYRVTPNHRDGSRFEVRTPVSIAAVRGTVFRISLPDTGGANAEVLRGAVGISGANATILLSRGFGAHADATSPGTPVRLLPPPRIARAGELADGVEVVELVPVPGAARYRVQLAKGVTFAKILAEGVSAQPALTLSPVDHGTYYLRTTAIDATGLEGTPAVAIYEHRTGREDPGRVTKRH